MSILQAILLGIIQGLTEFLPVSSSGHLLLLKELMGVESGQNIVFETVVHAATVLSTITVLWKFILNLFSKFFKFQWNTETQYIVKIFISMIPVMIVGLFFKAQVASLFGESVVLAGVMLLVTAVLLTLTNFITSKTAQGITYKSAIWMGIAQAIAVLPGLSRSGATISAGLFSGARKKEVTQFSFLMVLIPILGETFLDFIGGNFSAAASGIPSSALFAGFLAAFISGLFACKFMIEIVKKIKLYWFAIYCAIVGIIAIIVG
ncbi:MAG: undecaprenyl-diphosphate phosphatase [Bacteroidales bacterium]|jgi:undecaprenyl-diphosphatase|nr:undecaprenyl-diphosphate phosphatase [Bacteroidales bacterium]